MSPFKALMILLLLLVGPAVRAGTVSPALEARLQGLGTQETIKVLVVLADQADIKALDRDLRGAKAALPVRHLQVVTSLRTVAAASQAGLLNDLSAKAAGGGVLGFTSHWLINAVVVTATAEAVREIAARADVDRVEPDLAVSLIEPVPGQKSTPTFADSVGIGLAPGIQAVGAPRVWRELGIDGTGTIVGTLDSGVDGTHPALADRWRGNFAPVSECWLDAVGIGDPDFPVDRDKNRHGTHVMGTLTGLAPDDTIGVAPGAHWIAANAIIGGLGGLDNAVLASLEFMADPDGDPLTSNDVPDVVQNSWGVSEAFDGYFDCDSRWWDAIDNCEAAGVVLVWSAGNEGPSAGSLRSPADRASTPLNCFSVGAAGTLPPYDVADFSSRGPSGCGGAFEIKPEVVAPGVDIYSAGQNGGYRLLSGTSMAGPHVAGVVALMRQANPDIDVASIKEILMATAIDLGDPGQDNNSGHGFIDAYAAVTAVMDNVGTLTGTVTDQDTGQPLAGAVVTNLDGFNRVVTDAAGNFSITMLAGSANFGVSLFGYFENGFSATVTPGGVSNYEVSLIGKPTAVISGQVTGPDGQPVSGAMVTPLDIPVMPAVSDTSGFYSLALPNGPAVNYDLQCTAPDLGYGYRSIELVNDLTVDFLLPEISVEDFETGDFLSFPWTGQGQAPWTIDADNSFEGAYCARAGNILNDQSSVLQLEYYVSVDSYIRFRTKVSSEYFYDFLVFYLDGQVMGYWSGERDWELFQLPVARGHHTFQWVYLRDVAYQEGQNTAWVDFIEFPTTGEELFPGMALNAYSVPATVEAGASVSIPLTLTNTGDWVLDFQIKVGDLLKDASPATANPVDHVPAVKGSGPGEEPVGGASVTAGGPDAFGYQWRTSEHPSGPVYDWVDISGDGLVAGTGDEAVLGPFALGFPFTFYGTTFNTVRISTNGFLSFTSDESVFQNQGIPDPAEPNNILAAFWDDLDPGAGGTIYYLADPGGERFIVQYDQVLRYETPYPETFQIILQADGNIVFQYAAVEETGSCTVGIENAAGDDGLLVSYISDGFPKNDLAVMFEPPFILATVDPAQGQIAPGSSLEVSVNFDASLLDPGFYVAVMTISNTDPLQPELLVPLLLTVNDVSDTPAADLPAAVVFSGAVPNPFNPATKLRFSLPVDTEVTLDLYDVAGRRIRSLAGGPLRAGRHEVAWDGQDDAGRNVASGTYFARLTAAGVSRVKSVTLVR